jgi:hypothetical protein
MDGFAGVCVCVCVGGCVGGRNDKDFVDSLPLPSDPLLLRHSSFFRTIARVKLSRRYNNADEKTSAPVDIHINTKPTPGKAAEMKANKPTVFRRDIGRHFLGLQAA